jgi:hypothetical protein
MPICLRKWLGIQKPNSVFFSVRIATLSVCFIFNQGCAHQVVSESPVKRPPLPSPLSLKLISEKGRQELTVNCSESVSESYVQDQIREKKIESLDFRVQTTTTDVKAGAKGEEILKQTVVTIEKDGDGLLHDYAYPEPGENLELEFTSNGKVLKAGAYPKESVFFLPAVPLPEKNIQVGDVWSNTNTWKSEVNGMPLKVNMISKFVGPKACGKATCAEVEVSGVLHMPDKLEKETGFTHSIKGRYLFEPRQGLLVWSEFLSNEQLRGKGVRAVLHSTLRSELTEPPGFRTEGHGEPSCPFETKEE